MGLDGLVGVGVAPTCEAYLIQGSLGLGNIQQRTVDKHLARLCQRGNATGGIESKSVALTVTNDALLYRVVPVAVHRTLTKGLCRVCGLVGHGNLYDAWVLATLVAGKVYLQRLKEFHFAVAVVAPSCHNNRLVVVGNFLALLYHHYRSMQDISLCAAGYVGTLYADGVCTMS